MAKNYHRQGEVVWIKKYKQHLAQTYHLSFLFTGIFLFWCLTLFSAQATPITLTGADLASHPDAIFPTGTHSVSGASLLFSASGDNTTLYRLPLDEYVLSPGNLGIRVNVTRRYDDFNRPSSYGFGVYISDGLNLFGFDLRSAGSIETGAFLRRNRLSSNGNNIVTGSNYVESLRRLNVGFYNPFDFSFTIHATSTSTILSGRLGNQALEYFTSDQLFNLNSNNYSLYLGVNAARDNPQINSLTFTSGVVERPADPAPTPIVEPSALSIASLGLLALGLGGMYRRSLRFMP